jgi:beta-N-acetylhexosaminidase
MPTPATHADAPHLAELGLAAARRALGVQGDVRGHGPILVVELEGSLSVAAGPVSHDLTSILRERGTDAETVRIWESTAGEAVPLAASEPSRRLVVVVHDLDRHPWQGATAAALLAAREGGVVVDVGYPAQSLPDGARSITTFGVGRASLTAAADLLLGA